MNKYRLIALILIAGLIVCGVGYSLKMYAPKTYRDNDLKLAVTYPAGWDFRKKAIDNTCCLFVAFSISSSSVSYTEKGEKVVTKSVQDQVKLQIGTYDKTKMDPFKTSSTTLLRISKHDIYYGTTTDMEYYLMPRTDKTGIGIAVFSAINADPMYLEKARSIVSTIDFY